MAVRTFRVTTQVTGNFAIVDEIDQAAANRTDGWVSAKLAPAFTSEFDVSVKRASGTFSTDPVTPKPPQLILGTAANAFRTPNPLKGTFANTNWTFTFALRCTVASAQRGRMQMRIFKGPNSDGTGATQLTGSTLIGSTTPSALSTTADQTSVVNWSPGGTVVLDDEYLFFAIAWYIVTAGGSNSADVVIRTGQAAGGSRLDTPDFTAAPPSAPDYATVIDNFNRTNNAALEAGAGAAIWSGKNFRTDTSSLADLRTLSNALGAGSTGGNSQYTLGEFDNDCDILFDCAVVPTSDLSVYFLMTEEGTSTYDAYELTYSTSGSQWFLDRVVNGVGASGVSGSSPLVVGDTIWIRRRGSEIRVYKRPSGGSYARLLTWTDATFNRPGVVAFETFDTTQRWDNFSGGPYTPPGPPAITKSGSITSGGRVTGASYTVPPSFQNQIHYRFREDTGTETTATWFAATDVPVEITADLIFRLRFALEMTLLDFIGGFTIQYRRKPSGGSFGAWDIVGASTPVEVEVSPYIDTDSPTTQQISSGPFTSGYVLENDYSTNSKTFTADTVTEMEFVLNISTANGAAVGDEYEFRLIESTGSVVLDNYVVVPRIIVAANPAFPSTGLLDDFTRANQYPPGGNWYGSYRTDCWRVQSNQLHSHPVSGDDEIRYNAIYAANQEAYFTVVVVPTQAGGEMELRARHDDAPRATASHYLVGLSHYAPDTSFSIRKRVGGVLTSLISNWLQPGVQVGDQVGIQVIGNVIRVWYKPVAGSWRVFLAASDNSISSAGRTGLYGRHAWALDDFSGGTVVLPTIYTKTGSLISATTLSGAEATERQETGSLVADTIAAGVYVRERHRTGILTARGLASGTRIAERIKVGSILAAVSESAIHAEEISRSGLLAADTWHNGFENHERSRAGSIVPTVRPSGISAYLAAPFPSVITVDSFTRADQYPPGGSWLGSSIANGIQVFSNRLTNNAGLSDVVYWNSTPAVDGDLFVSVAAVGQDGGGIELQLRRDHVTNTCYFVAYRNEETAPDKIVLGKRISGANTDLQTLHTFAGAIPVNDGIGIRVKGNQISGYLRTGGVWAQVGTTVTDNSISAAGVPGIRIYAPMWALDDFGGPIGQIIHQKTGILIPSGVFSGADAAQLGRTGVVVPSGRFAAADVAERAEAGSLISNTQTAGVDAEQRTEFGTLVATARNFGVDAEERSKPGLLISRPLHSGNTSGEQAKLGAFLATAREYGADVSQISRPGSLLPRLTLDVANIAERTEFGSLVARALYAGVKISERAETGVLVASVFLPGQAMFTANLFGSLVADTLQGAISGREKAPKFGTILVAAQISAVDVSERAETGRIMVFGLASAAQMAQMAESGSLRASAALAGLKQAERPSAGFLTVQGFLSALEMEQRTESGSILSSPKEFAIRVKDSPGKAGTLVTGSRLTAIDAATFLESGKLLADTFGAGLDAHTVARQGLVLAGGKVYGADVFISSRTGSIISVENLEGIGRKESARFGSLFTAGIIVGEGSYYTAIVLDGDEINVLTNARVQDGRITSAEEGIGEIIIVATIPSPARITNAAPEIPQITDATTADPVSARITKTKVE